jgi:murein L,D-transpeptidase YcbB/YkuD
VSREVQQIPPAPREIVRVSSPRYYTYKPAALTAVSIASLLPAAGEAAGLEPSLDFEAKRFAEALRLAPETSVSMEKGVAEALKAHYAENPKFIWSRGNSVTAGAKAVVELLEKAGDHGLEAPNMRSPCRATAGRWTIPPAAPPNCWPSTWLCRRGCCATPWT